MIKQRKQMLVEKFSESYFKGYAIAVKTIDQENPYIEEEILHDSAFLAAVNYLASLMATRVLYTGEDKKILQDEVTVYLDRCFQQRVIDGKRILRNEMKTLKEQRG